MTDLERVKWEDDPEAFIILRLQESSDPDAAHKAFQAHLKEDAERESDWEARFQAEKRDADRMWKVKAELAELREAVKDVMEFKWSDRSVHEARWNRLRQLIEDK